MTLYLACEDLDAGRADVDETVTVSRHAATVGRYRMALRTGEEVPLHVLLEGTPRDGIVRSGLESEGRTISSTKTEFVLIPS